MIIAADGREVGQRSIQATSGAIDVSIENGAYLLTATMSNGSTVRKRFIKEVNHARNCTAPPHLAIGHGLAQQPGSNDLSFNAADRGYGAGDGRRPRVDTLAVQADGGVLIGGSIQRFNNVQRTTRCVWHRTDRGPALRPRPLAAWWLRNGTTGTDVLVADGPDAACCRTADRTLPSRVGLPGNIPELLLQPDGRILAITDDLPGLVRMLPNGDLDPSFDFAFPGYYAERMALLPNGQFLVVMDVTGAGSRLLRFNSDGSEDSSFNCCPGPDVSGIGQILVQPDGRILITGLFNTYNGVAAAAIGVSGEQR